MLDVPGNYIKGEWVAADDDVARDIVYDPATNRRVGSAPQSGPQEVDAAVTAARGALPGWSSATRHQRRELIWALHNATVAAREEIADLISAEMGSPKEFARSEHVGTPIAIIANCAEMLGEPEAEQRIGNSLIVREPIGVVAAILPWNYPLYQLVAKVIPALAAACTVVIKPAELTPLATYRFTQLVDEVGFPPGVFNVVFGTGPIVGDGLSRHPEVDMVSFTGSTRAGRSVTQAAAGTIKRVALELGGKSASLLAPDADLPTAVHATVAYCLINAGQACNAWTRLVAPREQRDQIERLAGAAAAELEPTIGPLITAERYEQVQRYIAGAIDQGARLIAGGPGHPDARPEGHYARATVLADVTSEMTVAQEEVFGPVLAIQYYDSLDEGVAIANDSVYGLHGGVWAGTVEEGVRIARQIHTGQLDVNGAEFNVAAPFGGYKQSGNGRELGPIGLDEFLETKAIQLP